MNWQPIESAPKDGTPLILYGPDWSVTRLAGGWDARELAWRIYGWGCAATQPTHWMPLPEPPK